jgi:hypothetical protein
MIPGNTATFEGTCTHNGIPCFVTVNVTDSGPLDTDAVFSISISNGPPKGDMPRREKIQIRP